MSKGKWKTKKSFDGEKRTERITVNVSPEEKRRITYNAKLFGKSVSQWIVMMTLLSESYVAQADEHNLEYLQEFFTHLKKVDNNFNQATKSLNIAIKYADDDPQLSRTKIENALAVIEDERAERHQLIKELTSLIKKEK